MNIYGIVLIITFVCLMLLGIGDLPMFFRTICIFAAIMGLLWLSVCGICKVIFWCFGLEFTAKIGTGVFLVVVIAFALFKGK